MGCYEEKSVMWSEKLFQYKTFRSGSVDMSAKSQVRISSSFPSAWNERCMLLGIVHSVSKLLVVAQLARFFLLRLESEYHQARSQKFAIRNSQRGGCLGGLGAEPPATGGWGLGAKPPAAGGKGVWELCPQRLKILRFFTKIISF